jgi:hypothetical protein
VTTGATESGMSQITSGLEPGDEVVMVGVDKLQEGSRVSPQVAGEKPAPSSGGSGKRGKKGS